MIRRLLPFALISVLAVSAGCKATNNSIIDHVSFKLADDLETARVSVTFKQNVQTNMAGTFVLKDYGYIFVNPFTSASQPLELGFELNTKNIVSDQDYAQIAPTDSLPNGLPLGLGYPLVQVKAAQPISPAFDLYGYVDVLHAKWIGAAAMFKAFNDASFPAGMAISMGFNPDSQGNPGILTSIYGPVLDNHGVIIRNGGIILLANVHQLTGNSEYEPGREYQYLPKKKFKIGGPGVLFQ